MTNENTLADALDAENGALSAEKDARRWERLALRYCEHLSFADRVKIADGRAQIAQERLRAAKIIVEACIEKLES